MRSPNFRFLIIGLASALVLLQFVLVSQWIDSGQLPSQLAIHWGFNGVPDGFGDSRAVLFAATALYLTLILGLILSGALPRRRLLKPMLFGLLSFLFAFFYLGFGLTIALQIDRSDQELTLEPLMLAGFLFVLIALSVFLLLGNPAVSVGSEVAVRVRGVPILRLSLSEITGVELVQLRPRDFGGVGIRYARRTLALIPSAGSGILIHTDFGESIAVRTEDPQGLQAQLAGKIGN